VKNCNQARKRISQLKFKWG